MRASRGPGPARAHGQQRGKNSSLFRVCCGIAFTGISRILSCHPAPRAALHIPWPPLCARSRHRHRSSCSMLRRPRVALAWPRRLGPLDAGARPAPALAPHTARPPAARGLPTLRYFLEAVTRHGVGRHRCGKLNTHESKPAPRCTPCTRPTPPHAARLQRVPLSMRAGNLWHASRVDGRRRLEAQPTRSEVGPSTYRHLSQI